MVGKITQIDEPKGSRFSNNSYIRVHFKMINADGTTCWNKTDLVKSYRNWENWKDILHVGNTLSGLVRKGAGTIDADSVPGVIAREEPDPVIEREKPPKQEKLL